MRKKSNPKDATTVALKAVILLIALGANGCVEGSGGSKCYSNGKCNLGFTCSGGTCVDVKVGFEGGECWGDYTCSDGLDCAEGHCTKTRVEKKEGVTVPKDFSNDQAKSCDDTIKKAQKEIAERACVRPQQLFDQTIKACDCTWTAGDAKGCEVKWSAKCDTAAECGTHKDCPAAAPICRNRRCAASSRE